MRTGLVARKEGMTRFFRAQDSVPATILKLEDPVVVGQKTTERDGYDAVVVGSTIGKAKHVNKQQRGAFAKAKIETRRKLKEFRVTEKNLVPVGAELVASHFVPGQFVDATATSIGKGFAGGMKRHNFGGLEATHGVSISHRSHGSTGQCQEPGRVFKGKKMAGQMGNVQVTEQNMEVLEVDDERGLIVVKGCVPGSKNSYIVLKDAVKVVTPQNAPLPAGVKSDEKADTAPEAANEDAPAEEVKAEENTEATAEAAAEAPAEETKAEEKKDES